jgi:hypothetical protein
MIRISIRYLLIIASSIIIVVTACKKDDALQNQLTGTALIESIRNNNLENIIIPHHIDDYTRLIMVQNLGFRAWELDLNYFFEGGRPIIKVKHNYDFFLSPSLEEYLRIAKLENVDKLWFDVKNMDAQNFSGILLRMHQLDSIFDLKNRVIFESSNNSNLLKTFRENGWHTAYYLPDYKIDEWIIENDTSAQKQYAESLIQQLYMQDVSSISFNVSCYSFVKDYLENEIQIDIVYHTWDLSLKLNDLNFIDKYKKKVYSKDPRIKTVLIPID